MMDEGKNYCGVYEFAGIPVKITSVFEEVQNICKQYATDKAPLVYVKTGPEEITAEKSKLQQNEFRDPYCERLAVYRQIAEKLLPYHVLLFHGSAVSVDGKAYIFAALSGTGKSTHARLWREVLGNRVVMVNDDKPLIRIEDTGEIKVYGTPWNGKHNLSTPIGIPLKAICSLERGKKNEIHEISLKEAYPMLLQQIYRTGETEQLTEILNLMDDIAKQSRFCKLTCNMEREAAEVSYAFLSKL